MVHSQFHSTAGGVVGSNVCPSAGPRAEFTLREKIPSVLLKVSINQVMKIHLTGGAIFKV